jgi:hypothetical protein
VYATNPPEWWPYWVIKVSGAYAPPSKHVLIDNGAFGFYQRGEFPELDVWIRKLRMRVIEQRRRGAREVYVVLPDYPMQPTRTAIAAKHARKFLCHIAKCVVVMHFAGYESSIELREYFESYVADIEADLYAVPMKLPTVVYYSKEARRAVTDVKVQMRVVSEAHEVAKMHGVNLHLLAPNIHVIKRVGAFYTIVSFDTTEWTRAITPELKKRVGTISVRNKSERELYFTEFLDYISKYVRVEGWERGMDS